MEPWQIGFAQVPLESPETLKWLFSHTNISNIIESQILGESLIVEGVANFTIEWHMSANLKALKSMYGLSEGTNTKYPCLYCMASMGTKECSDTQSIKRIPTRNTIDLSKFKNIEMIWDSVLPIDPKTVHICALHARVRIVDKLLRLHSNYAYSLKLAKLANECLENLSHCYQEWLSMEVTFNYEKTQSF